jgi:uncharacterized protein YgiB involved in biofilm formation
MTPKKDSPEDLKNLHDHMINDLDAAPDKGQAEDLQSRRIRRTLVWTGLAFSAVIAIVVFNSMNSGIDINKGITDENANEPMDAIFYQNAAQCEADMKKQQDEYAVSQKKYQNGELDNEPTPPPLQVADCAAQLLAAQQEHDKTAPVYTSAADCQADGVQCEVTPAGSTTAGYRPIYGGTYLYPYHESNWVYINQGGYQHRVYETRPVYQSINAGRVVTPYGREISQTTTGRVQVPRHTTVSAPARPSGTTARGTIKGRSSQGFGSSFKSTGSGGK